MYRSMSASPLFNFAHAGNMFLQMSAEDMSQTCGLITIFKLVTSPGVASIRNMGRLISDAGIRERASHV